MYGFTRTCLHVCLQLLSKTLTWVLAVPSLSHWLQEWICLLVSVALLSALQSLKIQSVLICFTENLWPCRAVITILNVQEANNFFTSMKLQQGSSVVSRLNNDQAHCL